MYLKCHERKKNGKIHRYWSIAEKRRVASRRLVDRHVLYLGEINDSQREAWKRCIEALDDKTHTQQRLALYPDDRPVPDHAKEHGVQLRLSEFSLRRPRQWGACWAFLKLWETLGLERFWRERLPASRQGTDWYHVLVTLCAYRLIDPGSEWRLHRQWFEQSAMADLLGEDFSLAAKDNLYRCLDRLLEHKREMFGFLKQRWVDLFGASFEVLLYDLTSTYFESDPPFPPEDKRRFGYSRDKRPDCVQVVIALVVTPEGFPLAYEVMAGNTSDKTTLREFLDKIEDQYGKARRIRVMDRGIPTEETLEAMRQGDPPVQYLVGTPKGRLNQLEKELLPLDWQQARPQVEVKLLDRKEELYVLVKSQDRVHKERSMRRRKLKQLWERLKELKEQRPSYERLLMALGAARKQAGRIAWGLIEVTLPKAPSKKGRKRRVDFDFSLNKTKLRQTIGREGRYLLRSNLTDTDPAKLWGFYLQLVQVEEAFKNLKGDLAIRPIHHRKEDRIEAHIFVSFIAYCIHVTLGATLKGKAPGLTSRQFLEKLGSMQMLDVHFPTSDGRELIFTRYTQSEKDQQLLLAQVGWELPIQPPPRITAKRELQM